MNPSLKDQKIELVVITNLDPSGEVEGEIMPDNESQDTPYRKKIRFDDHPPVSVGDKILARIINEYDPKTNMTSTKGKFIRQTPPPPEKIIGIIKNLVNGAIFIPTTKKNKKHYGVDKNKVNAVDGELVQAQISRAKRKNNEKNVDIIRRLGSAKELRLASLIAIKEYEIPDKFSDQVSQNALQQAKIAVDNPTDLTAIPFISIDPSDAKDHDDAIYATKDPSNAGGYIVWVAIADVAKYIPQDSALDLEALKRGNSTYLPDLVVPMIPDVLSNNMCSLKEAEFRSALVVQIWINKKGEKTAHQFFRCVIKNTIATTYEKAQSALDAVSGNKIDTKLKVIMEQLNSAYRLLQNQTKAREPLDLELIEQEILFDNAGEVAAIRSKPRFDSHKIVEEFMILANICAAETIKKNKLPFLYRIHEPPAFEKLLNLKTIAKTLGVNLNTGAKITSRDLNNLLKKAKKENCSDLISMSILRSMSQAQYSPENQSHFGLSLPCYTHFTSPIRRYSDLLIHRALIHIHKWDVESNVKNQVELLKIGEHLSGTERRSMLAERDTKDRYLASFLKDRIGGEFSARINGLSKSGIFVRLHETGADGFIPISYLHNDRYKLNNDRNKLIGRFSKITINIGANVVVKLKEANPISGNLIFNLIEYENETIPISNKSGQRIKKRHKGKK